MLRTPAKIFSTTIGTSSATVVTVLPVADIDSIYVKVSGLIQGGSVPNQDIYIQTTDDGGTTFYDLAHLGTFSGTTVGTNYIGSNASWAVLQCGAGQGKWIGTVSTLSLAANSISGLPLLSRTIQIQNVASGTIGTCTLTVTLIGSQSGGF